VASFNVDFKGRTASVNDFPLFGGQRVDSSKRGVRRDTRTHSIQVGATLDQLVTRRLLDTISDASSYLPAISLIPW